MDVENYLLQTLYLSDPDSGPTYWQQTITHMKQNCDTVIL